ncbi:hypothetical protein GALL_383420 [mine drainage metagenome]|uniref:Lipoprotein n=1 Tax=mine drainage metagenome TaxID=410659 RepID=A0A1J5QVJ0_9ZZZZ
MYTHKLKIRTTAAFLTLSAVLLVAGCSSTPSTVATAPATVAPTTPAATPSATPTAAAVVSGTVLTPAQVAKLPDGVRAYPMPDGTKVAVVRGEPLPAPVQAAVTATVNAALPGGITNGQAPIATQVAEMNSLKASLVTTGTAMGRQVIAVYPIYGVRGVESNQVKSWFWTTTSTQGTFFDTAAQAQAAVASFVNANPTGTVVIVISK